MTNISEILKQVQKYEIIAKKNVDTLLSGKYKSIFKGTGIDFDEIRLYTPGDPIKNIDWKTTARLRKPYVKIFREEHEVNIFFIFDSSASMNFHNKKEIAIKILATFLYSVMKNGDPFSLISFTNKPELFIKPAKGRKHMLKILKDLLITSPQSKTSNINSTLIFLKQHLKRKNIIIFISDFLFNINEELFHPIAKKNEIILIRLFSPEEQIKNLTGILPIKDLETNKINWLLANTSRQQKKIENVFLQIHNKLTKLSNKYRFDYLTINTSENYLQKLKKFIYLRNNSSTNIII